MNIWSDNMILLAVSNTEMIVLIAIGLLLVGLIGFGLIHYTKVKMEQELDEFSVESKTLQTEEKVPTEPLTVSTESSLQEHNEEQEEVSRKETRSEIEILLEQMQSDLEHQSKTPIHTFEEEQEEKSIISYQELKAMKENRNHEDEIVKYEKEQEEKSVLSAAEVPLPEMYEEPLTPILEEEPVKTEIEDRKKNFSNSDFISPVYGKMEAGNLDYPKIPNFKEEFHIDHNQDEIIFDDVKVKLKSNEEPDLERTFDLGPMSEEIKKNDEFLKALKEFRNNLE